MKLTKADIERHRQYRLGTSVNSLGNLHERMRAVRTMMQMYREAGTPIPNDLEQAIWDLETEVSFHVPAKPPYGKRTTRPGSGIFR
jgi:uncharacterized membrane protein